jgi:amino acid adenylation domain-containing protein
MSRLVHQYCSRSSGRRPEAVAVKLRNWKLTYGELESISNRIGRMLREAGCRRGDRVILLLPKSPVAIASIVGILKADCIYVPVESESPEARARAIIESAEPRVILANAATQHLVYATLTNSHTRGVRVGWMDESPLQADIDPAFRWEDVQSADPRPLDCLNSDSDPAYIMYTSGSTGTPKGVVINHSNIAHFIDWAAAHFSIGADDRLSGHTPLHFDLSVLDIFASFSAGAELHLVPLELNLQPRGLADFIRRNELTQWFSVPAVLNYMAKFNVVAKDDFPALRRVMWCGEVFPVPGLRYWMTRLPHVTFTNLYGPTETTVASSYYTVTAPPSDDTVIPIGRPCGGEQLWVLDHNLKPVQQGEAGDLYIGGAGLSSGYWKEPEKTAAAFIKNPFGSGKAERLYRTGDLAKIDQRGLIYFLGRSDSQIKSRGYRIELGEIEAALHSLDGLKESAVVAAATNGFESVAICCAYSPSPGVKVTPIQLRELLKTKIPAYMLPSRWMELERLPRNANGKTDKSVLKELFSGNEATSGAGIH